MNLRNIIWNLLGLGLPLLMALAAIPLLITNIGTERFGLLGLAWGLVGYASILDFGMSRALTQKLARNRDGPLEAEARIIVKSAVSLTLAVSGLFMIDMIWLAFAGIDDLFAAEQVSTRELTLSVIILAFTLPIQAVSMTYRGINEAYLNFRGISVVRILLGAANFGAPCALSFFTVQVHLLVLTLLIARICALVAFYLLSRKCLPAAADSHSSVSTTDHIRSLLQFGGWIAVSSVLVPLLLTSDRYFIGAIISTAAVANYVIPFEMLTQGLVIVGAITSIAFPSISQLSQSNPEQAFVLFVRWTKRITVIILVIQVVMFAFLPKILELWVGNSLDQTAVTVGRILTIGVCAYPIGNMCTIYLHAYGRAKVVAVLQMFETPPYLLLLAIMVYNFGEVGAAAAWSIRACIDSLLLTFVTFRMQAETKHAATTVAAPTRYPG